MGHLAGRCFPQMECEPPLKVWRNMVVALAGKPNSQTFNRFKLLYTCVTHHLDEGLQMVVRMHALKRQGARTRR